MPALVLSARQGSDKAAGGRVGVDLGGREAVVRSHNGFSREGILILAVLFDPRSVARQVFWKAFPADAERHILMISTEDNMSQFGAHQKKQKPDPADAVSGSAMAARHQPGSNSTPQTKRE
jgi:hypothetical protein